MSTVALLTKLNEQDLTSVLQDVAGKLDDAEREFVLDFSAVRQIHPSAIRALQEIAGKAEEKSIKVALCGVNVHIYKVLKLVKVASKFSYPGAAPPTND